MTGWSPTTAASAWTWTGPLPATGPNVQQWACDGAVPQQQWSFRYMGDGYFQIIAQHSGKCLDVDNAYTYDGANVKQWACVNVPQQLWYVEVISPFPSGGGLIRLRAKHSGKCLDVDNAYTFNGANVKQWTCVDVPQQTWIRYAPTL